MGQTINTGPLGQDVVIANAGLASPINLPNIPSEANSAIVAVNNGSSLNGIRYFHNRDPASNSGARLLSGQWIPVTGSLRTFKIVREANEATLEVVVSYFS